MNSSPKVSFSKSESRSSCEPVDQTLRLIAGLPAPEGLVDRVQAGLKRAPRTGRILSWSNPGNAAGGWMSSSMARGAAAAAIVCVVAGGGWRVYSRVQPAPTAKVIVMPPVVIQSGSGFSPAGAKRVPQTLQGPVLKHPVAGTAAVDVVDRAPVSSVPATGIAAPKKKKPAPAVAPAR